MIRTQIQLEEKDFKHLKEAAARESCSVSAFVRKSVLTALAEAEHSKKANEVMEVAGKYKSGKGDLAENHDKYLDEGW